MAAQFINLPVIVTLLHPPNATIIGRVSHINEETLSLGLEDVFYPSTGGRAQRILIEGRHIEDIKIQPGNLPPPPTAPTVPEVTKPTPNAPPNPPPPVQRPQQHPQQRPQQHPQQPQQLPRSQWPQYQQNPSVPPLQVPRGSIVSLPQHSQINGGLPPQSADVTPTQARKPFLDPAILSMGRPPSTNNTIPNNSNQLPMSSVQEAPATPIKPAAEAAAAPVPKSRPPVTNTQNASSNAGPRKNIRATLTEPFSGLDIGGEGEALEDTDDPTALDGTVRRVSLTKTRTGKPMDTPVKNEEDWKRTRRGGKGRKRKTTGTTASSAGGPDVSPEASRKGNAGAAGKGKGWRQTPLLHEDDQEVERTPGVISGKVGLAAVTAATRKEKKQRALEKQNGWATEDATDIQELPEFDFANNLAKFDKRSIFEKIRTEDTTADEDRLVSFNRVQHRPGTYGGKNLHPSENVLDGAKQRGPHAGSLPSDSDSDFGGSSKNSRRAMSRASSRRNPQRTGSGVIAENLPGHAAANSLLSRTKTSFTGHSYTSSHATASPLPGSRVTPPESPFPSPAIPQGSIRPARFRSTTSGRTCHTITPGTMAAVEEMAQVDFGMTEEIIAENAGRGIAEVALAAINPGGRRLARENLNVNAKPVVVVLVGNHKSGARAVVAARHLRARGVRVMIAVLGFNRDPSDRDRDLRRQTDLYNKYGGTLRSWTETEQALMKLDAPPELIIDALLGRNREWDSLVDVDQKEVLQIVGWANKSRAGVLAVEGPSGINAATGEAPFLDGEFVEIRAKHIVCLGAPRSGLLRALEKGPDSTLNISDWNIWIIDIGLNQPWKRANTVGARGTPFGSDWIVKASFATADEGTH